jgi:hypothetical protein
MTGANNRLKKILIAAGGIVFVIVCWNIITYIEHRGLVKITVDALPNDSLVTLDGKNISAGGIYVKPGEHTLKASRQYFESVVNSFNTNRINTSAPIYLLPIPNTAAALKWLEQNPAVQQQREAEAGVESDSIQSQLTNANSFFNQLPIIYGDGQGGFVRIDEGAPLSPGGPPTVYVTAATPAARQGVLTYMRSRGYDPAAMNIVFNSQSIPIWSNGGD